MSKPKRLAYLGIYGKLKVLDVGKPYISPNGQTNSTSICECLMCGVIKTYLNYDVRRGHYEACGCLNTTHGMSGTPEYITWKSMLQRCYNSNIEQCDDYGGRGITVCDRWKGSFENFFADMGYRPTDQHSLDREDNDGDYEPSNCRWATSEEQNNNKRDNRLFTIYNKTMSLANWCRISQVPYMVAYRRLSKGIAEKESIWTPEEVKP